MAHHVVDHGAREGVLRVGVDVHLDDAVGDGQGDLVRGGAGAAVHDEVEGAVVLPTDLRGDLLLDGAQDLGAQLDVAGLVHAVDVAEGEGGQVAAVLAQAQGLDGLEGVLGGGVELLVDRSDDAVLLAADDADLDLQDRVGLDGQGQHLLGDLEVLVERHGRAVPHVGLEGGELALGDLAGLDLQQRAHPGIDVLLGAVVSVQGDGDAVVLGDFVSVGGQGEGTRDAVLDGRAGAVLGAADRHLDDAVGLGLGEALKGSGHGLGRGHVDRGVGELAFLRAIQHLGVNLGGCDRHGIAS